MNERLRELHRQRELLRQHLAWLEREIADAEPGAAQVDQPPLTLPTHPSSSATNVPSSETSAEDLLSRYREDERLNPHAARSGCLLAVVASLLVLVAGVLTIYFVYYAER